MVSELTRKVDSVVSTFQTSKIFVKEKSSNKLITDQVKEKSDDKYDH